MKLDSAIFYSNDIDRSVKFYTEIVGFELQEQFGENFASFIFDNGVKLGIKFKSDVKEVPGKQTIIVESEDISKNFKQINGKGVKMLKALTEESYGSEFSFEDPDGNKVIFMERG